MRVLKSYNRAHYQSLEGWDVKDIGLEQLANVKKGMAGKKPKTKANVILALARFFNWLKKNGTIKTLPDFPEVDKANTKHIRER